MRNSLALTLRKHLTPAIISCSLIPGLNVISSVATSAEPVLAAEPVYDELVVTVPEALSRQDEWNQWVNDRRVVVIQGRYSGRAGSYFRLKKLPFSFEALDRARYRRVFVPEFAWN